MIITGKARWILTIVLLSLLIGVRATNAQTPDDAAVQAYRDGQYNDGITAAEQVLGAWRNRFIPLFLLLSPLSGSLTLLLSRQLATLGTGDVARLPRLRRG